MFIRRTADHAENSASDRGNFRWGYESGVTVKGERIGLEPNWLLIEKTKNVKQRRIPLSKAARNTADHLLGYDFARMRIGQTLPLVRK